MTVIDNTPPVFTQCPGNIIRSNDANACTAVVTYAPPASDNCSKATVTCTPPSGTAFPLGTTSVSCTATDTSGNAASCSFTVTMFDACLQDDSNPATSVGWNSLTGDYRYCCGGTIPTGRGTSLRKGMTFSLSDGARRLTATLDATQNKGSASLQVGGVTCGITTRDIRNNTSPCALTGGS